MTKRPFYIENSANFDDAKSDLEHLNKYAGEVYWPALGYTVLNIDGVYHLVSKNAKTGEDDHSAPMSTSYAILKTAPNGHTYFSSPRNSKMYYDLENGIDYKIALSNWGYTWKCETILKPEEYYED